MSGVGGGGAGVVRARLGSRLRGYRRADLSADLLAGLLVAALAVPQSLGYAAVAGVPVQVGLYTLPPALLAYAFLGSSRVLFVGPVSTVSVLSGSIVHAMSGGDPVRAAELTSALAILAGIALVAAGLLRLGWVAQFLSAPIVTGFVTGLVVLIVVGEMPGLLGLPTPTGTLLDRSIALVRAVPDADGLTLSVAGSALVLLFVGSRFLPRVPWSLVVLVLGVTVSHVADLAGRGAHVVGAIPSGLHWPDLPHIRFDDLPALASGALAIAGAGIAEHLAAARTFAPSAGGPIRDDVELVANGAADLAAGFVGGMGVAGSLSKTAANVRAGARTRASGAASAGIVVLVLLFATRLIAPLPRAVLSAIVIHAVWGLVHPGAFVRYRHIRRNDAVAAGVACLGALALGPVNGLLVAVGQSLLGLVYRSVQVHVDEMGKVPGEKAAWGSVTSHPERRTARSVVVLRPDALVFWANANTVLDRIRAHVAQRPHVRALVLDLEATNQLDTTTADLLDALRAELHAQGVDLYLVRVFASVRVVLERTGFLARLGEEHLWHSISAGVKAAKHAPPLLVAAGLGAQPGAGELTGDDDDADDDSHDDNGSEGGERIVARTDADVPAPRRGDTGSPRVSEPGPAQPRT